MDQASVTGIPPHWSYSQWEDFTGCAHRYRLKRTGAVDQVPSVAAVAGKAWHKWSEFYDLGGEPARSKVEHWEEILTNEADEEEQHSGIPRGEWRVGGRASKSKPNKEDLDFWMFFGWQLAEDYMKWAAKTPWTIATDLPPDVNGRTVGIEYGLEVDINGDTVRGFLDRISRDEFGNLGVVDYKTGSWLRHSVQLGWYRAEAWKHGIVLHWGAYYDARKGMATTPVSLTGWTPGRLADLMATQSFMRTNGMFPAQPGAQCDYCPVRKACEFHF